MLSVTPAYRPKARETMVTGSRASGDRRSVSAETTKPAAGSQKAPCLVAQSSRGWDDTDTEAFHRVHHFGVLALTLRPA